MEAYTSVASQKIPPNSARKFLLEVGAEGYTKAVMKLAHSTKEKPYQPIAGMSEDDIKAWLDVKIPTQKP